MEQKNLRLIHKYFSEIHIVFACGKERIWNQMCLLIFFMSCSSAARDKILDEVPVDDHVLDSDSSLISRTKCDNQTVIIDSYIYEL